MFSNISVNYKKIPNVPDKELIPNVPDKELMSSIMSAIIKSVTFLISYKILSSLNLEQQQFVIISVRLFPIL